MTGTCSAEKRRGLNNTEIPEWHSSNTHDAGVIGDPVGNRHRRTRGVAASTEPTGGAKKNTADHRRAQDSQEGA